MARGGPVETGERGRVRVVEASELLDRLKRGGHLERRRDMTDRRRVSLQPRPERQPES